MRRVLALGMVLGLVVVFGGMAFAGEFGGCSYGSHLNTAKQKANTATPVATKSQPTVEAGKVLLAQQDKTPVAKPAPKN